MTAARRRARAAGSATAPAAGGVPDIPMAAVASTSIAAAGYEPRGEILRIRFVGGGTYDYLEVPAAVFAAFEAAGSKGRFVNAVVKPFFAVRQVG